MLLFIADFLPTVSILLSTFVRYFRSIFNVLPTLTYYYYFEFSVFIYFSDVTEDTEVKALLQKLTKAYKDRKKPKMLTGLRKKSGASKGSRVSGVRGSVWCIVLCRIVDFTSLPCFMSLQ